MIISSMQNPKVKELKKLASDKSLVFFDNPKLVEEAYMAGHQIIYLLKKEGVSCKTDYGGEVVELSSNVFEKFSTTVNSQGVIGVVKLKFTLNALETLAIYKKTEKLLDLSGNPKIIRDNDTFSAQEITLNMETEEITLDGKVRGSVTEKKETEDSNPKEKK